MDVSACRQFLALQRQDLASLFKNGEELLAQVLEPGSDSAVDLVVVFRGLLQAHEESPPEKRAQELVEEISEKYEDELRAQFEPWEKVDPSESDALENAFWEPLIEVEDRAMSWIIFAFKSYIGTELLRGLGEVSDRLDPDLVLLYPYLIEIQSRSSTRKSSRSSCMMPWKRENS